MRATFAPYVGWLFALAVCAGCSSRSTYELGNGGASGAAGDAGSGTLAGGAGDGAGGASAGGANTGGANIGGTNTGGTNTGGTSTGGTNTAGANSGGGIERIASTTTLIGDGSNLVVDLPSSVLPDDVVVVTLYLDDSEGAALDDPLGFTMTAPLAAAGCGSAVVWYGYRVVPDGDPDLYTFSFSGTGVILGTTAAFAIYRGADPQSPFSAQQAQGLEEGNFALPNLGPLAAGSMVVAIFTDGFNESGSWEPPPGMSEFIDTGWIGAFEARLETAAAAPLGDAVSSTNGCGTVYAAALAPL
jgi:hypothetical protein